MKHPRPLLWGFGLTVALAAPAAVGVLDELPKLPEIWACGIVGGLVGVLACRWRPALGLLTLWLGCFAPSMHLREVYRPSIAAAILREFGPAYIQQVHAAYWTVVIGHGIGLLLYALHRRHTRETARKAG